MATAFAFLDTSAEASGDFFSELNVVFNVGFGDQAFVVGSSIQEQIAVSTDRFVVYFHKGSERLDIGVLVRGPVPAVPGQGYVTFAGHPDGAVSIAVRLDVAVCVD